MSRRADVLPTSAFDYSLPADRIAYHPAADRSTSRLLVLERATGAISHRTFQDIRELIAPGDALVLNETRVFPARVVGRKPTGAAAEVLLIGPTPSGEPDVWDALVRPGAKLKAGSRVIVADDLEIEIVAPSDNGVRRVRLHAGGPLDALLERYGRVPLPPYIAREPEPDDRDRYQTVYARASGSVAAPTAGLHFTESLLDELDRGGTHIVRLVLHVGPGTFRPVATDDPSRHRMHAEPFAVPAEAAARINAVRTAGGRVWAVGTTVVRALETVTDANGYVHAGRGRTALFIRPPFRFRAVDRLITNFHLPRSTLLMLVCAFGGHEQVLRGYAAAIEAGYRFYSYGDAMAVV